MERTYEIEDRLQEEDLELRSWEMRREALVRELWIKAQSVAKTEYEESYGNWEDADKYERQDYVQSVFERLCEKEGLRL